MTELRLFAINRGAAPIELRLPPECIGELRHMTLDCPPEALLGAAETFTKQGDIGGGKVVLPAYSISLIASPAALKPPDSSDAGREPVSRAPTPHAVVSALRQPATACRRGRQLQARSRRR